MNGTGKKRGILLTIWLALMIAVNAIGAIAYIFFSGFMANVLSTIPIWVFYILGLLSVLNIVFAIALFMWKKWGFLGFCGVSIIAFFINIIAGFGIISSLSGFLGVIIIYLLMKPKWELFE